MIDFLTRLHFHGPIGIYDGESSGEDGGIFFYHDWYDWMELRDLEVCKAFFCDWILQNELLVSLFLLLVEDQAQTLICNLLTPRRILNPISLIFSPQHQSH